MRFIDIDTQPFARIPCANAGRHGKIECIQIPLHRGTIDRLPDGVDALLVTADLQMRELANYPEENGRLLGEALPDLLPSILSGAGLPEPSKIGVILAGDMFTVERLTRRGGHGDVAPVWRALNRIFSWVTGVAGNHDMIGSDTRDRELFLGEQGIHYLDRQVAIVGGLRFAGVPGAIGNPKRPNSWERHTYESMLIDVLGQSPDLLILHDGPDVPGTELLGREEIREALGVLREGTPVPIIRGHCHWERPLAELPDGTQILNVDSRIVVLERSGIPPASDSTSD